MRYLWVEDFNEEDKPSGTLGLRWKSYFELGQTVDPEEEVGKEEVGKINENTNINYGILEDVLKFLDKLDSWNLFDAILIDIRFKVSKTKDGVKKVYNKYFSSFLLEDKYRDYANVNDCYETKGDVNSASSGVLLYLALIHRYNYSQERIAFISANISTSEYHKHINTMQEILEKGKYAAIKEEDKDRYKQADVDLYNEANDLGVSRLLEELPKADSIVWGKIDKLEEIQKELDVISIKMQEKEEKKDEEEANKEKIHEIKYNTVEKEFKKVGLKLPKAFEKPDGELGEISWLFKEWREEKINVGYYKIRSFVLDICEEIKKYIKTANDSFCLPYQKIRKEEKTAEELKSEIKELFSKIEELFPRSIWTGNADHENMKHLYYRIVKECASPCDGIDLQRDQELYNSQAILKLARNWSAHQGINDVSEYDVVFIFHILVNTFVDIGMNTRLKEKNRLMVSAFCNSENTFSKEKLHKIISEVIIKCEEECPKANTKKANTKKANTKKANTKKEKEDLYDKICMIGAPKSPIKTSVAMKHLYALYLDGIKDKNFSKVDSFDYSVAIRAKDKFEIK